MSANQSDPRQRRPKSSARLVGNLLVGLGVVLLGVAVIGLALLALASTRRHVSAAPPPDTIAQVSNNSVAPPLRQAPSEHAAMEITTPTAAPTAPAVPTLPVHTAPATAAAPLKSTPPPTPAPKPSMPHATHIAIPAFGIDTTITEVGYTVVTVSGQRVIQWQVADFAAGHDSLSANPGEGGNIVITGHDDWKGEVFKNLAHGQVGDQVILTTPKGTYRYAITEIHYRQQVGVRLADQLATGTFLAPMPQERVTLVTCWPYGVDTYRLIVVAKPVRP